VFKNYALEGRAAAELVVAALTGADTPAGLVNGEFDNNFGAIPTAYLDVESIDETNLQVVVEEGLYTKEQLCEGVSGADFCA
jgi:D-xylose transport system substrate-binding protein